MLPTVNPVAFKVKPPDPAFWLTQLDLIVFVPAQFVLITVAWIPEFTSTQPEEVTLKEAVVAPATNESQELFSIDPQKGPP